MLKPKPTPEQQAKREQIVNATLEAERKFNERYFKAPQKPSTP